MRMINKAFTPAPAKILRHADQLMAFKDGTGRTAISTHIVPTAACNLNCSYCAYAGRDKQQSIELDLIKTYVAQLQERGLRAVVITGGGEPCLYKDINALIEWLRERQLELAMITNGTCTDRVEDWKAFKWVRISVNIGYEQKIALSKAMLKEDATLGLSYVYQRQEGVPISFRILAGKTGADYVRILPDLLLPKGRRDLEYEYIEADYECDACGPDERFQLLCNSPRHPSCGECHLVYFRPFLTEVNGGTVFPCCLQILGSHSRRLEAGDGVCRPEDIGEFLDKRQGLGIVPSRDCGHCTNADTVEMVAAWASGKPTGHDLFV